MTQGVRKRDITPSPGWERGGVRVGPLRKEHRRS
jgi:hypothetical protein